VNERHLNLLLGKLRDRSPSHGAEGVSGDVMRVLAERSPRPASRLFPVIAAASVLLSALFGYSIGMRHEHPPSTPPPPLLTQMGGDGLLASR
jgi:hypothetical protein